MTKRDTYEVGGVRYYRDVAVGSACERVPEERVPWWLIVLVILVGCAFVAGCIALGVAS